VRPLLIVPTLMLPRIASKESPSPYLAVFAPNNAAFAAFLTASGLTAEQLLTSPTLAATISNHVIPG